MACSVYQINKGINRPIEFKGFKAQYIWWLGGGLVTLLIIFTILYIIGIPPVLCVLVILIAGTGLFFHIYKLSRKYGQHGMMKELAKRSLPGVICTYSRKTFTQLLCNAL
jgi:hypothetical protein